MKKILGFSAGLAAIALFIFISCRKDVKSNPSQATSVDVQAAKTWLSNLRQKKVGSSGLVMDSVISLIDWQKAEQTAFGSQNLLIVNFNGAVRASGSSTIDKMVFVFNSRGQITFGNIVEMSPSENLDPSAVSQTISRIYSDREESYSGTISSYTADKEIVFSLTYQKGNIQRFSRVLNQSQISPNLHVGGMTDGSKAQRTTVNTIGGGVSCTDWYLVTTYYYSDGSTTSESQYIGRTCGTQMGFQQGGGGGGTAFENQIVKVDTVLKSGITDTCLLSAVNLFTNAQIKNLIVNLYQTNYAGAGAQVNLSFVENPDITNPDGTPAVATSTFQNNLWTVNLNPGYSNTASQEFLAAAAIHEVIHSFVAVYAIINPNSGIKTVLSQHEYMLNNFASQEISLLQSALGVSLNDATALAFAGYDDLWAVPADAAKILTFGLTQDQITSTDDAYSTGTSGKVCK